MTVVRYRRAEVEVAADAAAAIYCARVIAGLTLEQLAAAAAVPAAEVRAAYRRRFSGAHRTPRLEGVDEPSACPTCGSTTKRCPRCGRTLPITHYQRRGADNVQGYCPTCNAEASADAHRRRATADG